MGLIKMRQAEPKQAIEYFLKADEIKPCAETRNNLAGAYCALKKYGKAKEILCEAVKINPDFVGSYGNLALVYTDLMEYDNAVKAYEKAFSLSKSFSNQKDFRFNYSSLLLLLGDYEHGFEEYEARWDMLPEKERRVFKEPRWNGEPFVGKRLLVYAEQGLGDIIQFSRYFSKIKELGGTTICECPQSLHGVIKTVQGIDEVVYRGQEVKFDLQVPIMSLARLFKTTLSNIPNNTPYIFSGKKNINLSSKFNIGLAFATGLLYRSSNDVTILNDSNHIKLLSSLDFNASASAKKRSCPIENFDPLFALPNVQFYSLQKGDAENLVDGHNIISLSKEINDWSDTAGIIEQLDLVISVDTSVLHLAGAMGKRTWALIPATPDWKFGLKGESCPWYPTVRIFRQQELWKWDNVINELKCLLIDL